MTPVDEVPEEIVSRLREICLRLPEAYEEQAWVGRRWRVRRKTFAHVLTVESGWPPAYARAARTDGPAVVLTFRASGLELDMFGNAGHPFFRPVWFPDIVGMILGSDVDWPELAELLTESYRVLAPRRLARSAEPPRVRQ
jgi:predicted DNA-binding protein (MmcQ/YjbR family)